MARPPGSRRSDTSPSSDEHPIPTLREEQCLWGSGCACVAGVDEAGRGAWAGPIVAAAVAFSPLDNIPASLRRVRDSKQLSPACREELLGEIRSAALAVGVGVVPADVIDRGGILAANRLAMAIAVEDLRLPVEHLLIDYLCLPAVPIPQSPIVGGDARCLSIAAASIVAKVTRDRLMVELDAAYPGYSFGQHKGYGTPAHRRLLLALGSSPVHRLSFAPMCQAALPMPPEPDLVPLR